MWDGSPSPAIVVENLTKRFGEITVVDGISFAVELGSVFGFLGPNGAGQRTTIWLLTGEFRREAGTARVAGHNAQTDTRGAQIGIRIVLDQFQAYPDLTAWQNLLLAGEN